MLVKMHDALQIIGRRIRASRVLRQEDGGKVAWAKRIDSFEGIPDSYRDYFESHHIDDRSFPYMILIPGFEILGHTISEKLIATLDQEVHILERSGNAFSAQSFPLNEIQYVEWRTILLYSHIKISGLTGSGEPASTVIQFNSVTDHVFTPIVNRIRRGPAEWVKPVNGSGSDKFDHWSTLNYKFMNYARRSVLGGEQVTQAVLQPEIRESSFSFLGKAFSRMVSPTHAIILTDREWITIREEAVQGRKDKYGGTWVYISLGNIKATALKRVTGDLLALSIQLSGEERFEYFFQASRDAEVSQLLEMLEESRAAR